MPLADLDPAAFRRPHAARAHSRQIAGARFVRRIPLHVRAALTEGGFTPDDIKEIILQQTIYAGVAAANHAFSSGKP